MRSEIKKLYLTRETVKRLLLQTGLRAGDTSSYSAQCSGPPPRSNNSTVIVAEAAPPKTGGNTEV